MVALTVKPNKSLEEVLGGNFPTWSLSFSYVPLFSFSEKDNFLPERALDYSDYELDDIFDAGLISFRAMTEKLLPHKYEIEKFIEGVSRKYDKSDFAFELSLVYVYAKNLPDDIEDEVFKSYKIELGKDTLSRKDDLAYTLDNRFFGLLEGYLDEKDKFLDRNRNNSYCGEFFIALSDLFYYRGLTLTQKVGKEIGEPLIENELADIFSDYSEEKAYLEVSESRFKEEFLTEAERDIVYG